jgi:hypothetical protein
VRSGNVEGATRRNAIRRRERATSGSGARSGQPTIDERRMRSPWMTTRRSAVGSSVSDQPASAKRQSRHRCRLPCKAAAGAPQQRGTYDLSHSCQPRGSVRTRE